MVNFNSMPKEEGLDNSISLMREGYMYIPNRRHSFQSDIFETRLLGKKVICMGGKEAAELFYDEEKFMRKGAAPNRTIQTLFGEKGVQTLDGAEHLHRKEMFMSFMSPKKIQVLADIMKKHLRTAVKEWEQKDKVIFYEEVQQVLCKAACEWTGIPIHEDEIKKRTKELASLFESAGAVGPKQWFGRNARNQIEKWIEKLINDIRSEKNIPFAGSTLEMISKHRDLEGKLIEPKVAAVEIVNILRPIVAISIFLNFTALALHQYPEQKEKLQTGEETYTIMFVQEVRRFYPFFPFTLALVKKDFTWNGFQFEQGLLALLDLYGTNHDPNIWDNPGRFNPERFVDWKGGLFSFIPQGGGDYLSGHRCAGEWVTIEVMKVVLNCLLNEMDYEVPDQDLSFSMVSMPSIPTSKFIMEHVKSR